ncbi:hypothetical protein LZQ00_06800 [Sphingobacterium sp. SRCM116780]|uniref:hypothetical protein n=1 Tax=Sphingobacterium sp. SRCM116780 TaxID=2907623 RepID=UPI001F16D2DA|nr:hypothetical protein [Sphingobacterium sp. SRCM116780]UIR57521.1 hypothetical protein LZQ00_06800 [Sphingobacterium sp. SRCM116780]
MADLVKIGDKLQSVVIASSKISPSRALPRMIARLRWLIIDGIKADHSLPFHLLISNLNTKALEILADKS